MCVGLTVPIFGGWAAEAIIVCPSTDDRIDKQMCGLEGFLDACSPNVVKSGRQTGLIIFAMKLGDSGDDIARCLSTQIKGLNNPKEFDNSSDQTAAIVSSPYITVIDAETQKESPMDEAVLRTGRTIYYVSAPRSDHGVSRILPVTGDAFVISTSYYMHRRNFLFFSNSGRVQSLGNGSVSVEDSERLIFRLKEIKGYLVEKRGKETVAHGAFWYDALIDQNGRILKFVGVRSGVGITCMDRDRFENLSGIDLPENRDDRVCVRR